MKPLFKNTTVYNSKNYNQFLKFHGQKFSFSYNAYNIVMFILLIYCTILNIVEKNVLFVLIFLALLLLLFLIRIYLPIKRHEKTKKEYSKNNETSCTFSFYKFYFTVKSKTFYYFKLYKIFETKDYFYLYINDENAIIVSKTGFEIGTSEEFSEFIKKKCFFKYSKQLKGTE